MDNKSTITALDLVQYAWKHPKRQAVFSEKNGWTYLRLVQHVSEHHFRFTLDNSGAIDGIVIFELREQNIHIQSILASSKAAMRTFLKALVAEYPAYTLTARRKGTRNFIVKVETLERKFKSYG